MNGKIDGDNFVVPSRFNCGYIIDRNVVFDRFGSMEISFMLNSLVNNNWKQNLK